MQFPETQAMLQSDEFRNFKEQSKYWLESYALFRTLKAKNQLKYWGDWPETDAMDKEAAQLGLPSIAVCKSESESELTFNREPRCGRNMFQNIKRSLLITCFCKCLHHNN